MDNLFFTIGILLPSPLYCMSFMVSITIADNALPCQVHEGEHRWRKGCREKVVQWTTMSLTNRPLSKGPLFALSLDLYLRSMPYPSTSTSTPVVG